MDIQIIGGKNSTSTENFYKDSTKTHISIVNRIKYNTTPAILEYLYERFHVVIVRYFCVRSFFFRSFNLKTLSEPRPRL